MKTVLVQCPAWGTREPPTALVQLAACLKSAGHAVRSFDLNNFLYRNRQPDARNLWAWEQSLFWYSREDVARFFGDMRPVMESYADAVLREAPSVAGFSVAASSYGASVEFARILRRRRPALTIVFGGTFFHDRGNIDRAFDDAPVDYILAEESDVAFPELVGALEKGSGAGTCAGIHYRDGGRTIYTGERRPLADLDRLPFLDFGDLKIGDYDDTGHVAFMSSRGCVWNCSFCSSRAFWNGYRSMSGERVHREILHHRRNNPGVFHIDFLDLAFNGDMNKVVEFSRLMIEQPPCGRDFAMQWNANSIITPGLTKETLALMKRAGCQRLFFGIESGSAKVLKLMRKMYRPDVAVDVIRNAHAAGIKVTCNFMFGFPGETEEDFRQTLEFLAAVAPHVERVYPSRTYCALEEYSYFYDHPAEFGIRTPFNHHLYWETADGGNTYPVRLERCRRFEETCGRLGVPVDCGVKTSVELDNWYNLGMYYEYKGDYDKVFEYYLKYLTADPHHRGILERVHALLRLGDVGLRWRERFRAVVPEDTV